jgi:hypothetical protein
MANDAERKRPAFAKRKESNSLSKLADLKRLTIGGNDDGIGDEAERELESDARRFLRSLVAYCLFLALFVGLTLGQRVDDVAFRVRNQHLFAVQEFTDPRTGEPDDIWGSGEGNFVDGIWGFIEGHLSALVLAGKDTAAPGGYGPPPFAADGYVQGVGRRFGPLRIRHVRVKEASCDLPDRYGGVADYAEHCYAPYHVKGAEETACLLKNDDGTCKKGYSYAKQVPPTRDEYFASQHLGFRTQYPGNGGYIIDLPSTNATLRGEVIAQAKEAGWINWGTRAVFAEYTVFYPSSDLLLAVRLVWELPASGGVYVTTDAEVIQAESAVTRHMGVMVAEIAFICMLLGYVLFEVVNVIQLAQALHGGKVWAYVTNGMYI